MTHRIRDFWNYPMNRRQALKTTGGFLAAGAAGLGLPLKGRGAAKEPPNIIFIPSFKTGSFGPGQRHLAMPISVVS